MTTAPCCENVFLLDTLAAENVEVCMSAHVINDNRK